MTREGGEARPLSELRPGQKGRVAYIGTDDGRRLEQLSALGIVPDAVLRLLQKRLAAVVQVGETEVAIDSGIARQIYVRLLHRQPRDDRHGGRRRHRRGGGWLGRSLRFGLRRGWAPRPDDEGPERGRTSG